MDDLSAFDSDEVERYARILAEIKWRMLEVEKLELPLSTHSIEIACLHLRIVLEHIVFSSLVANHHAVQEIATAFDRSDVGRVRKLVRRVNENYWPRPVRQLRGTDGKITLEHSTGSFLAEADWGPAYGMLSAALHARNPFGGRLDPDQYRQQLHTLHAGIVGLLENHLLSVAGSQDSVMLTGLLYVAGTDGVHVNILRRVKDGESPTP